MRTHRNRSLSGYMWLFLVLSLLLSVWAIGSQRLDIRNRAADTNIEQSDSPVPPTGEPNIPPGCYEKQVKCFKAPCDPIVVCPSPEPTSCIGRDGKSCTIEDCPDCPPGRDCPLISCSYREGVCRNNVCVPLAATIRPTPWITPRVKPTCIPRLPCMDAPEEVRCYADVPPGGWICPQKTTPTMSVSPTEEESATYDTLLSHFGESGAPGWIGSDINNDGIVDEEDYSLFFLTTE